MTFKANDFIRKQVGVSKKRDPLEELYKINRSLLALGCPNGGETQTQPIRKVVGRGSRS